MARLKRKKESKFEECGFDHAFDKISDILGAPTAEFIEQLAKEKKAYDAEQGG